MFSKRLISPLKSPTTPSLNTRDVIGGIAGFFIAFGIWSPVVGGIPVADPVIHVLAFASLIHLLRSKAFPKWVFVLVASLGVAVFWSPAPHLVIATTARSVSLAIVGYWVFRNCSALPVFTGLMLALFLQAMLLPVVMFDSRTQGLAPTISRLGMVGFVGFTLFAIYKGRIPWYLSLIGIVTIAASGARAAAIGGIASEATHRRRFKYVVLLALFFGSTVFLQGGIDRLTTLESYKYGFEMRVVTASILTVVPDDVYEERLETLLSLTEDSDVLIDDRQPRPIQDRFLGVGVSSHHAAIGWPRPHNIFSLAGRELGVFLIPLLALLSFAIKRGIVSWTLLTAVLIYGVLDDSIISVNGHYGIAAMVLISALNRRNNNVYSSSSPGRLRNRMAADLPMDEALTGRR